MLSFITKYCNSSNIVYSKGVQATIFYQMPDYATPENFEAWRQDAKSMTVDALKHTIQDCREAEKAMRGWNPVKEGFYSDQASTYAMELKRRSN